MSRHQEFVYVLVKEFRQGTKRKHYDTELRIVHWAADEETGLPEHFVIYGKRPNSIKEGAFIPYRLKCESVYEIGKFVNTVISSDHNASIELRQFSGITDDSEDEYNIDWFNTNENLTTELVAFDIEPTYDSFGESRLDLDNTLNNALRILMQFETV